MPLDILPIFYLCAIFILHILYLFSSFFSISAFLFIYFCYFIQFYRACSITLLASLFLFFFHLSPDRIFRCCHCLQGHGKKLFKFPAQLLCTSFNDFS